MQIKGIRSLESQFFGMSAGGRDTLETRRDLCPYQHHVVAFDVHIEPGHRNSLSWCVYNCMKAR